MTKAVTPNEFTSTLSFVLQNTTFDAGQFGELSPQQLRAFYYSDNLFSGRMAHSAKIDCAEDSFCLFANACRSLLKAHIDPETDRLGSGISNLVGGPRHSAMITFAHVLIRAGAILGEHRTTDILFGWVNGKPLSFKIKIWLSGISVDEVFELPEGISIIPLPQTLDDLASHKPPLNLRLDSIAGIPGGAILAIDACASPALYMPTKDTAVNRSFAESLSHGLGSGFNAHSVCEALSLACDHCVRWRYEWRDLGDLEVFTGGCSSFGHTDVSNLSAGKSLLCEQFEKARDLYLTRKFCQFDPKSLDTSIDRWINSKKPEATLVDRFVELRIAMESLYLEGGQGEFGFRLATNAAWHLGKDFENRKRFHKIFRDAYGCASKAVHGRAIKYNTKEQAVLGEAQSLCREGIIKRLYEKQPPIWNDVILGHGEG